MSEPVLRYRLSVLSRCVAGIAGGYFLAQLTGVVMIFSLSAPAEEAFDAAALAGVLIFPAAVIWSFSCRTATRAWAGVAIPALLLGVLVWSLYRH